LRRALFGEKAGVFKEDGEDYDINVRFKRGFKDKQKVPFLIKTFIFRDQATGKSRNSCFRGGNREKTSGFSAIKH